MTANVRKKAKICGSRPLSSELMRAALTVGSPTVTTSSVMAIAKRANSRSLPTRLYCRGGPRLARRMATTPSSQLPPAVAGDGDGGEHGDDHRGPEQRGDDVVPGAVRQPGGGGAHGERTHGVDHHRHRLVAGEGLHPPRHRVQR